MRNARHFLAGITLAGYVQPNGAVRSVPNGKVVWHHGWPEEITVDGVTFTLEEVDEIRVSEHGVYAVAEYV